ncbi:hypothetical protein NPIL_457091 [Nephila pilipes]|uniref:Uncharacterized protein n=1 Tax=Nephila pilipes TaxID=299642 RepID=A0A8X6TZW5_NEPPI|nr:hypothetical protein NPIL_457091 [Nephila pilipes]
MQSFEFRPQMNSCLFVMLCTCVVLLSLRSEAAETTLNGRTRRAEAPDSPEILLTDLLDGILGEKGLGGVLGLLLGGVLGR